ncbi:unnamed protein product [marine sediment metagenome]|uniref:Uncharacterized protein n=1 Tax=marine sediment metagenome TaxID=412755 RepID=X1QDS6_9ZZZZ
MPGGGIVPKTISESEPIAEVKKITEPVSIGFAGAVYENEDTATTDDPRRFETSSRKLRDLIIQVSGNVERRLLPGVGNRRPVIKIWTPSRLFARVTTLTTTLKILRAARTVPDIQPLKTSDTPSLTGVF